MSRDSSDVGVFRLFLVSPDVLGGSSIGRGLKSVP